MLEFIDENAPDEVRLLKKQGRSVEEGYGLIFERVRPGLEAQIQEREAELDRMVEDFRSLSPKMRDRANARMEALQAEIDSRKQAISDLRVPWETLKEELKSRRKALNHALTVLGRKGCGSQKTEALRAVVSKIVCNFRYVGNDGKPTAKKSFLDTVKIVSVSGDSISFRPLPAPGPG